MSEDAEEDDWFESDSGDDESDELDWDDWETDDSDGEESTEPSDKPEEASDADGGSLTAGFDDVSDAEFATDAGDESLEQDAEPATPEPTGSDDSAEPDDDSGGLGSSEFFGGEFGAPEMPSDEEMDDPFAEDDGDDTEESLEATGGTEFDEEFESEIPRIDIGVTGLDQMIQGGVPARSLMVVMGSAGTGKTTFGLQFANRGLEKGEKAVYITLEETRDAVIAAASEKGWGFEQYAADDDLAIVDFDPIEMANSLSSIRNDLPRLIDDFGAERLVLDSVSLLEMMYDDQAKRRTEVFDFTKSLKKAGVTTMLTSEGSEDNPYVSRHGIIEYLTDAVFVLQYVRSEFQETRLAVEIQKIRNANHSRETKPYEITDDGISVYQQANIF
ncbi:KaiC domain-containing protein [Halosegnis rubeus]|uniref:KaiC domain-containing protein n=1 Tax=Halosegnis rubeus TaxID=2212850 RepID=A0A5N5UEB0_9EURY|nr:KaiC domain-containing protein [Halosegnis rubeus]KAB7515772.1 KaiC domain-containing protein [Halosegnis rubeus]